MSDKNTIVIEDDTRRVVGMPETNYVRPYELAMVREEFKRMLGDLEARLRDEMVSETTKRGPGRPRKNGG